MERTLVTTTRRLLHTRERDALMSVVADRPIPAFTPGVCLGKTATGLLAVDFGPALGVKYVHAEALHVVDIDVTTGHALVEMTAILYLPLTAGLLDGVEDDDDEAERA